MRSKPELADPFLCARLVECLKVWEAELLKNGDGGEFVAEDVVWAKLKSCREGGDIATRRLWGK
jgi:hypothetical protein